MTPAHNTLFTSDTLVYMTMYIEDGLGNWRWNNHSVWIHDNTAPTVTCPGNISVNATAGTCGAVVNYAAPIGTDNCSGSSTSLIAGFASGSTFPVGTTTVTYRVTAGNGAFTDCSFIVTVTDNILPSITCPANISATAPPGACGAIDVYKRQQCHR